MTFETNFIGDGTAPIGSRLRRQPSSRASVQAAARCAIVLGGLALLPALASAQQRKVPTTTTIDSVMADGTVKKVPIQQPRGFNLFAAEDLAGGAMRMSGAFQTGVTNQGGPISENQNSTFIDGHVGNGGFLQFEMGFIAGTPPTDFRKIRAVYPGINNMAGSLGFNAHRWQVVVPPRITRIGAADGQFGRVFSGVTAIFNSSCRDDNRFNLQGFSLLPMLDCPETWGSEGFQGKRVIADSVWLNTFNANKSNFRWDDWAVPAARIDQQSYLGTQSVYGFMSDYYREQKLRYGSIVPGGSGAPLDEGYPLGLEIRMDSWQFSAPATRNAQFYSATIVNKSAAVYGTGIDYDSLYFGLAPGFIINGQNPAAYWNFNNNTQYFTAGNRSGQCNATTYPRRYTNATAAGCAVTVAGDNVYTMTWLKSPIGDTRNKLFSNPASPYFNPTSPLADDTITFNHWKSNSFGQNGQNVGRSQRASFGMMSSIEANYLDGRNPSDLTLANYATLFQPEDWSGTYPTVPAFNKFVPGSTTNPNTGQPYGKWDYNNDGVQDTIFVPGCGRSGCAEVYSDTIAGGFRTVVGNILNMSTAGPFKLKANDTTQFLWAFAFAQDSLQARQQIEGLTNSYLTNYAGPQPFPFPAVAVGRTYTIASAELVDSTSFGVADVALGTTITIRLPQINPIDRFMVGLVNKARADSASGVAAVRRILRLNPGLLDRLSARANDNLASVVIFKSCNGGNTYTTTTGNAGTCTDAPTRTIDTGTNAFPWRPWSTVLYSNGVPATGVIAEEVQAGRSYLYSFVTRSRGFSDFRIVDSTAAGFVVTDVQNTLGFPADTINSALASSGPAVINVYAPITNVAGRSFASVDTSTLSGNATQSLFFGAISNDVSGTTRLVYGNQFIVRKTIDTVTNATTTTVNVRWVIPRAATSATGAVTTNFVAREQAFTANANIPVRLGANFLDGTFRSLSGSSRVFLDTLNAPAAYPGYAWVTGDNRPIFVINDQYAANRERDQQASPLYPGYTVVPRDSANLSNGFRQELTPFGFLRDRNFVLRSPTDTLTVAARGFVPQVQSLAVAGSKRIKGGSYELNWLADPWGPAAPFNLDPIGSLQATVNTSLNDVAAKSTTVTETSAAIATLVGATTTRPLQRVRVPFTMTFKDVDGRTENVRFAMLRRTSNTRLFGSGNDTVRVTIPDTLWSPGDTLIALQKVERDSSVGTGAARYVVVQADGANAFRPIPVLVDSIGLNRFLVSCNGGATASGVRPAADALTCNPLTILSRGGSASGGYLPVAAGWKQVFELTRAFDNRSVVQLIAKPFTTKAVISKSDLARVSVVPNPYIVRSDNDQLTGRQAISRITFIGVPEEGILRIYSVSGQYLQEITWTRADLTYQGNNAPTGDLPYNLRTREGLDLGSGLYLYVLTATGASGKDQIQRGKFVIIR